MKVLVTGVSGLIGSALASELTVQGHEVVGVSRVPATPAIGWKDVTPSLMNKVDAVVNLAGETISGRWTDTKKRLITKSRLDATETVTEAISQAEHPPTVLIQASASGYYGSRGDEALVESSSSGSDFLAELCRKWETAAAPVTAVNTRLVLARFSVVLASEGGALKRLKTVTRLGISGPLGTGRQWWSWISLHDAVRAILHLLENDISGPVNVASEQPQRQRAFTKTLGTVLRRPVLLPAPRIAIKAALGEMGESLLLHSARLQPSVLSAEGFEFRDGDLEHALRRILGI